MNADPKFILSLLLIVVVGAFDIVAFLFHSNLDPQALGTIIGILNGTVIVSVVSYWFGSSAGSHEKDAAKDATIAKLIDGKST